MANRIDVEVLLFSVLREQIGQDVLRVALQEPVTGRDLLERLAEQYAPIADYRRIVRLAVNQEYVDETHSINEGDEVALITPVSGG